MSTHHQIDLIEFPADSPEQLSQATKFFSDVFGWTYTNYGTEYSDTSGSGVMSGINATGGEGERKPLAVIYSTDIEATKAKITESGGTITADIYSFPGGRRFHFTDPAGNELAVWSE